MSDTKGTETQDCCGQKDPKLRILDAAAGLFARKGFAAVGVREIAKEADVNISMISYYFKGKMGVLKNIIETYFIELKGIISSIIEMNLPREENTRRLIHGIVQLARAKTNICKVAFMEIPFDLPEISEYKNRMLHEHICFIKSNFQNAFPHDFDPMLHVIIGPALISMIFSHFMLDVSARQEYSVKFDENFFDLYSDTIATIFISGIKGLYLEKSKAIS
ncbi:MAG: TetR/AcrR family transcriptional regulator [Bacteroidota bacterium]|nr:TetR/AcrR family transcriptional regulator [Bacteroidota bacterium]